MTTPTGQEELQARQVERVAQAIYEGDCGGDIYREPWGQLRDKDKDIWRYYAADAIKALSALSALSASPPEGWQVVRDAQPKPHARYLVRRNGVVYTATPCYGMHGPWWVPQQLTATSKWEGDPVAMLDTDEWCSSEESSALRTLAAAPLPPRRGTE